VCTGLGLSAKSRRSPRHPRRTPAGRLTVTPR
jgi:hypothetical protein